MTKPYREDGEDEAHEEESNILLRLSHGGPPPDFTRSGRKFRRWERIPLFIKQKRQRMESDTRATEESQKKAGVFNENRKNCRHVGNAFNGMFTCVPCDSLRREVQAFNVVEVDRLLSSGLADAMCVGEDGSHVLYLLLRQSIRESDTLGGDFADLDALKTETARSLLKHGADIACLDPIKHPDWHTDLCECIEYGFRE
jgi:hypothetical protein